MLGAALRSAALRGVPRRRWPMAVAASGAAVLTVAVSSLAAPAAASASIQASAGNASLQRGIDARPETGVTEFWESLGDPALDRLIRLALDANHDLRTAVARIDEARAARTEARLDLLPRVTATAGYSLQRQSSAAFPGSGGGLPHQDIWDAGVQMSWELDVFGRIRKSLEGRDALLASSERDADDMRILVAAAVARSYFELRGAQDRLGVALRNADNQSRTLDVTRYRLEAGSGTALDTERAHAQLSSTLAAVPLLEAEVAAARHRVAVLLGRPPTAVLAELDTPPATVSVAPEVTVDDLESAARDRPDVRSAAHQLEAQSAFVGAARADYLPRLSIGGVGGVTASGLGDIGASGAGRYAIGPVVSWPLFDLGRVKAGVAAARAAERGAAARYDRKTLEALEEAETSLARYRKARERLAHLEDAAAASERATDLARLRFEEGGTGFLEVLDAERRQLEAQDLLAAGRSETTALLVAVYRALGGQVTVVRA